MVYLEQYFDFSNKMISKIEQLETTPPGQFEQALKSVAKNILTTLPQNLWYDNIYGAIDTLLDTITQEYELYTIPVDDGFDPKYFNKDEINSILQS